MKIIVREIIQLLDILCIIIFQGPGKGGHDGDYSLGDNTIIIMIILQGPGKGGHDGDYCQEDNTITRHT